MCIRDRDEREPSRRGGTDEDHLKVIILELGELMELVRSVTSIPEEE